MSYLDDNFDDEDLDPKELMKQIKKEINTDKSKLNEFKNSIYLDCMKKIKNALKIGDTDIFYKVPSENNVYKHYNSKECLYYIQKKLRKNNFQTFIDLNENMIFITWKYLKEN